LDIASPLFEEGVFFVLGLALLTLGADWLIRGSSLIAEHFGVSRLVVGLTVVAFGTSAPELVVSGSAAFRGQAGLAVGNIMGSTVANVGLIVGLGALIRPLQVQRRLLVGETPLLILILTIVMLLSLNDAIGRLDGLALVTGFAIYLFFLLRWERAERRSGRTRVPSPPTGQSSGREPASDESAESAAKERRMLWTASLRVALGIPALLLGADWLVGAAVVIARTFEIPEAVIGATIVAVGTSLPELASTIAAAVRGMGDIAIGNVIGSNVFNLGLVLGTAALLRPLVLSPEIVVRLVLPALIFCILLVPIALTKQRVDRWEGALLLTGYAGFILWTL